MINLRVLTLPLENFYHFKVKRAQSASLISLVLTLARSRAGFRRSVLVTILCAKRAHVSNFNRFSLFVVLAL